MKQHLSMTAMVLCLFITNIGFAEEFSGTELLVVRPQGSWPPWEIEVDDSEPTGIHIELIKEVAKSLSITVTIRTYPWKRAVKMLEKGDADAVTYMSKTGDREQFGYFFEGNILSISPIGFFILKKNQKDIHFSGDISSLAPFTIGTCRGFAYDDVFDKATYLKKDDGASNERMQINKLLNGRFEVGIGYLNDIKYNANQLGVLDQIAFLRPYLSAGRPVYIVFSKAKRHEELAKRFSESMKAYKATSHYISLLKKYGID